MAINPIILKSLRFFEGLDDALLNELASVAWIESFKPMQIVLRKGDVDQRFCVLFSGSLQIVDTTVNGQLIGIGVLSQGDYFGELSVIDGKPRSANVLSLVESKIIFFKREHVEKWFYASPSINKQLIQGMAEKIRTTSSWLLTLNSESVKVRVAKLLLKLSFDNGNRGYIVHNVPSQATLALMINSSRESVSRALNEFKRSGLIEPQQKTLIIRKADLEQFINSDPD